VVVEHRNGHSAALSRSVSRQRRKGQVLNLGQVYSLLDVQKIVAARFCYIGQALERASIALGIRTLSAPLSNADHDELAGVLKDITRDLSALGLEHSLSSTEHWQKLFESHQVTNYQQAQFAIDEIRRSIYEELGKPLILFLNQNISAIADVMKKGLERLKEASVFPSSWHELDWAVHCYRMEAYTACVFHSMRAIEKVLCVVAKSLGVPYEFEQWQTIIEGIESKIKNLTSLPKGQQKAEDQEFYSMLGKEFRYFKDAWRNHVAHSRSTYDDSQAKRVCEHVIDFIQHASTRLTE
jgi:hypothetical protein